MTTNRTIHAQSFHYTNNNNHNNYNKFLITVGNTEVHFMFPFPVLSAHSSCYGTINKYNLYCQSVNPGILQVNLN